MNLSWKRLATETADSIHLKFDRLHDPKFSYVWAEIELIRRCMPIV